MKRPNLLVLAGHDPSGGAGIQADIESAAANGAHAACVLTLLTRQDTRDVYDVKGVDGGFFGDCIDTLYSDMHFAAVKTGALGSVEQVAKIAAIMQPRPWLPLVVDPVLRAAGGGTLADDAVGRATREQLFARACVITPNAAEARLLCANEADIDRCGAQLAALGCHVLITGGDEVEANVINRLYRADGTRRSYEWPRLPGIFHGSGCTLASAIAARLACGLDLDDALEQAQAYTWRSLAQSFAAGSGQAIPARPEAAAP